MANSRITDTLLGAADSTERDDADQLAARSRCRRRKTEYADAGDDWAKCARPCTATCCIHGRSRSTTARPPRRTSSCSTAATTACCAPSTAIAAPPSAALPPATRCGPSSRRSSTARSSACATTRFRSASRARPRRRRSGNPRSMASTDRSRLTRHRRANGSSRPCAAAAGSCTPSTSRPWRQSGQRHAAVEARLPEPGRRYGLLDRIRGHGTDLVLAADLQDQWLYRHHRVPKPMLILGGGYDTCEDAGSAHLHVDREGTSVYVMDADGWQPAARVHDRPAGRGGRVRRAGWQHGARQVRLCRGSRRQHLPHLRQHREPAFDATTPASWTMTKIASLGCDSAGGTSPSVGCPMNRKFLSTPDVVEIQRRLSPADRLRRPRKATAGLRSGLRRGEQVLHDQGQSGRYGMADGRDRQLRFRRHLPGFAGAHRERRRGSRMRPTSRP